MGVQASGHLIPVRPPRRHGPLAFLSRLLRDTAQREELHSLDQTVDQVDPGDLIQVHTLDSPHDGAERRPDDCVSGLAELDD